LLFGTEILHPEIAQMVKHSIVFWTFLEPQGIEHIHSINNSLQFSLWW